MEKKHACDYENCKAKFARPSKLAGHKRVHTGERPYKCQKDGCDKSYTNSSHLKRHVESAHCPYKSNVVCSVCNLTISSISNLRRHHSRVHKPNAAYPYRCEECSLGFYKKYQLAEHAYVHTGVAPYSCDLCRMKFTSSSKLNKHERSHKVYYCECKEVFNRWSDYLKHKRSNHKKVYRCDECRKSFDSKSNYVSHGITHSGRKDAYECPRPDCRRSYVYKKNLSQHVRVSHGALRYRCPFDRCDKEFTSKQRLTEHRRKVHTGRRNAKVDTKRRDAKVRKKRAKRRDAGTYKRSTLLKLSGLTASIGAEKRIIEGDFTDIEIEDEAADVGTGGEKNESPTTDRNSKVEDNADRVDEDKIYFTDANLDIVKEAFASNADEPRDGKESDMKMIVLEHKKFNTNILAE